MRSLLFTALILTTTILLLNTESCRHMPSIPPIDTTGTDTTGGGGNGGGGGGGSNTKLCDPDTVYFEQDILPFLVSTCGLSGCHDPATAEKGVILTSYNAVMSTADVRPFDTKGSDLYEVITDSDPDDRMPPPPKAALSSAQIALIAKWINQGALNLTCGDGDCDTTNITYSGTVQPILQTKCMGCHTGSAPGGGINLGSYSGVAAVAGNGKLYGAIAHNTGYSPMPKNGPKLPDCEIKQIKIWIGDGAPNN